MNLTPAQHQLANLSLQSIMGSDGKTDSFVDNVSDLSTKIWSEFIDEEVTSLLNDDQLIDLGELLEDEDTLEEDISEFLNKTVPGFDEMYQEKVLDNKATIVEGRIKQLRIFTTGETDKQLLLDECEELIEKEEWLKVQDILATDFAEY